MRCSLSRKKSLGLYFWFLCFRLCRSGTFEYPSTIVVLSKRASFALNLSQFNFISRSIEQKSHIRLSQGHFTLCRFKLCFSEFDIFLSICKSGRQRGRECLDDLFGFFSFLSSGERKAQSQHNQSRNQNSFYGEFQICLL